MTWSVSIPHRSRDDSSAAVISNCRHLETDDDRAAARQIVFSLHVDHGLATAGEMLDYVESLAPAERRAMIDEARAELGLESTAMADAGARIAASARRPEPFPMCASPECTAIPVRLGAPYIPDIRRWHCPAHVHLAAPEDLKPIGTGLKYAPGGAIIPDDPADDARERDRAASERRQRESRDADAAPDADERQRYESHHREQLRRELPEQFRSLLA